MTNKPRVLVTGAGGFIAHFLVKRLKQEGFWVRGVDLKNQEFEASAADQFEILDLRRMEDCLVATRGIDQVYNLAADMGGIGYITGSHATIARNNTLINVNMLEASRLNGVARFLFSSSACVYPAHKQHDANVVPLKEDDAIPADPEPGYGWEKLYAEELCRYYGQDFGLETRIVRFHNVYGPMGTYEGGKEKAPAALCRKIALARNLGELEIWGDGEQTRSFMYIDDCVEGLRRIMDGNHDRALNLGTDRLVSVNRLAEIIGRIAGKTLQLKHDLTRPQGVRGRNSDNSLTRKILSWEPAISLEDGLTITYRWIESELMKRGQLRKMKEVAG